MFSKISLKKERKNSSKYWMAQKYVIKNSLSLWYFLSNYILLKSIKTGIFKANNLIDVVFLEGTVRVRQGLFGVELA